MTRDDGKRAIGKVISVTADQFVVEMHSRTDNFTVVGFDDVHYVAMLGSFVMIPARNEYVVAEVVGLREKESNSSAKAEGELDKAESAKFLDVVPVGMLPAFGDGRFRFGVSVFPSLYADALYALDAELDRIFETEAAVEPSVGPGGEACVPTGATRYPALGIGQSVVFEGYEVKVRIDDFFGGHLAVLGNTGSGKSCTVASVLQALFEKPDEHHARGATFVVFDVNGEYDAAFARLPEGIGTRRHILDGTAEARRFRLPHWFLDFSEWELLLQASERTQVPILRMALGLATMFASAKADELLTIRNHILATCITEILRDESPPGAKETRIRGILQRFKTQQINSAKIGNWVTVSFGNMANPEAAAEYLAGKDGQGGFIVPDLKLPDYDNTPFDFTDLENAIDLAILYEEAHGNRQIRDYCSQMVTRFKALEERREYAFLRHEVSEDTPSEKKFLGSLLGLAKSKGRVWKSKQIIILDMNAVEDEVVELVSAVIARMIHRLLRHADPRNRFPVHLLLEEAHRYVSSAPHDIAWTPAWYSRG